MNSGLTSRVGRKMSSGPPLDIPLCISRQLKGRAMLIPGLVTSIVGLSTLLFLGASIITRIPITIRAMTRAHTRTSLRTMMPMLRVVYPFVWTMKFLWVTRMLGCTPSSLLFGRTWGGKPQSLYTRVRLGFLRVMYTPTGHPRSICGWHLGEGHPAIPHTQDPRWPFTSTRQTGPSPASKDQST